MNPELQMFYAWLPIFAVIGAFAGIAWLAHPKCNRRWCWRLRPAGLHWCRECMDNHVMIAGSDESESPSQKGENNGRARSGQGNG